VVVADSKIGQLYGLGVELRDAQKRLAQIELATVLQKNKIEECTALRQSAFEPYKGRGKREPSGIPIPLRGKT
jgi:hypothetical protein